MTPKAPAKSKDSRGRKALPKIPFVKRAKPARPVHHVDERGRTHIKAKQGPPRIELTHDEIEQMKAWTVVGVGVQDIATMLGISKDVIEDNYLDELKKVRVIRNAKIRRKQYDLAMDGNVGMLVWLGKQWCGQRDQMLIGEDPDNPIRGNAPPLIEIVFVESDGDGRPKSKTIEGNSGKELTDGSHS
jgi:predicted DNA-binding protein (UPF0251 family)